SRRRHTRLQGDWSSDVCSSDLLLQAVLAALFLAGVSREVTLGFELRSKLRIQLDQRPGDAELHRARLSRHAASTDRRDDVVVLLATDQPQWRHGHHPVDARREVIVDRPPVDGERTVAGGEADACDGFLAPSGPELGW